MTPKFRNHFFESICGKESSAYTVVNKPWDKCPQLWQSGVVYLPDHEDPEHKRIRPYSSFVISVMPKIIRFSAK